MFGSLSTLMLSNGDGDPIQIPTDLFSIVIRAIQTLSPLLPLLTTGLCEDRVVRALDLGLLYPAAAPMSIFGCLGIAKAGFIALCASIDGDIFDGPALLRNAGIQVSGIGELLLHVKESKDNLYLAEDRLRTILSKRKVRSVEVNLRSSDFLAWNRRLLQWTIFLNIFGIIPYIPLFIFSLPNKPFHETWLYPILRISGSAVVAISLQVLFQLRLLEEVYHRLRFLGADAFLKERGRSLPSFWDHNQRSKNVFAKLEVLGDQELPKDAGTLLYNIRSLSSFDFTSAVSPATPSVPPSRAASINPYDRTSTQGHGSGQQANGVGEAAPLLGIPKSDHSRAPSSCHATVIILRLTQILLLIGVVCIILGYIGCFGVVLASGNSTTWWGPLFWLLCEGLLTLIRMALWASNPPWDDPRSPFVLEKRPPDAPASDGPGNMCSYGVGWGLNALTADDVHALIIGINTYPTRTGFQDLHCAKKDGKRMKKYLEETLMVPCSQICTLYDEDATKERIVEELKGLRHRGSVAPNAPIVIYFAGHSVQEGDNTFLVPYLPNVQKQDREDSAKDMIAYTELVDLLSHIGNEKTENIVVIFDTCHAGALGRNNNFLSPGSALASSPTAEDSHSSHIGNSAGEPLRIDTTLHLQHRNDVALDTDGSTRLGVPLQSALHTAVDGVSPAPRTSARRQDTGELFIGYSSHILLAGTSPHQQSHEMETGEGGLFTTTLLNVLQNAATSDGLNKMTYKTLVEEINEIFRQQTVSGFDSNGASLEVPWHSFQSVCCTTIHQKRLLFDGLFARKRDNRSTAPLINVLYTD